MGTAVSAAQPVATIHQLIKDKFTVGAVYAAVGPPGISQTLLSIASFCSTVPWPQYYRVLGSKEVKFGLQIINELIDMFVSDLTLTSTRLLALETIQSLLVIQPVCRKAAESDLARVATAMKTSNVELFIGALGVLLKVFKELDDDNLNALFFQLLNKNGCTQKFFSFVTQASVTSSPNMLCASIVILDIMLWAVSKDHPILLPLRPSVRSTAFQHKDSLFELSRHPVRKLSYFTTMLIIKLMVLADKETCLAIQDAALSYGSILWTFQKVVSDICAPLRGTATGQRDVLSSSLCTYAPASMLAQNSLDGYNCFHFDDDEDVASDDTVLPAQLLLALYCLGNNSNRRLILQALPISMSRCLFMGDAEGRKLLLSAIPLRTNETSVSRSRIHTFLQLVQSMMPSISPRDSAESTPRGQMKVSSFFRSQTKRDGSSGAPGVPHREINTAENILSTFAGKMGDTANWILLFDVLGCEISTPILQWSSSTLSTLRDRIDVLVENLDISRRLRHEAWDCSLLDVHYTQYDGVIHVCGIFLNRILNELVQGTHEQYIEDSVKFSASLLERAISSPSTFSVDCFDVPVAIALKSDRDTILCLRVLYLMFLRYPEPLRDFIPMSSLYCLLRRGIRQNKHGTAVETNVINSRGLEMNPLWVKRVCDLLSICFKRASREDLILFARTSTLSVLLKMLSDFELMCALLRWRQAPSDAQHTLQGSAFNDGVDSEDVSEAASSDAGNDTLRSLGNVSSGLAALNNQSSGQEIMFEGFEGRLLVGEEVFMISVSVLHRALSVSASTTSDIDADGSETSNTFSCLMKILWLSSAHGIFGSVGLTTCVDKISEICLRILRSGRAAVMSMAQNTVFIRVLISVCIDRDGSGCMSLKLAELLMEIISCVVLLRQDIMSSSDLQLLGVSNLSTPKPLDALIEEVSNSGAPGDAVDTETLDQSSISSSNLMPALNPVDVPHRRRSYRENLLLAASSKRASEGAINVSSADAVSFLNGLIPMQLVRLCTLVNVNTFVALFNAKDDIHTAELVWGQDMRKAYLHRCIKELSSWLISVFGEEYESNIKSFLNVLEQRPSDGIEAEYYPHVYGVYLLPFLKATADDFVGAFNPSKFVTEMIRQFDDALMDLRLKINSNAAIAEFRLSTKSSSFSVITPAPHDRRDATLLQSMNFFSEMPPARKTSLLLLSINRLFQFWKLDLHIWIDIVFSRICACLTTIILHLKSLSFQLSTKQSASLRVSKILYEYQMVLETMLAAQLSLLCSAKYPLNNEFDNKMVDHNLYAGEFRYFSPNFDRILVIVSCDLASKSLMTSFVMSATSLQNAVSSREIRPFKRDTTDLLHSLATMGSAFLFYFIFKLELLARHSFQQLRKTSSSSAPQPLPDEGSKLFRRGSIMDSIRGAGTNSRVLTSSHPTESTTHDSFPSGIDSPTHDSFPSGIDRNYSFPPGADLKSESGTCQIVMRILFDEQGVFPLLLCCRKEIALISPQAAIYAMSALRHLLALFPLLKSNSGISSTLSNCFNVSQSIKCYYDVVDLCVNSALHLFLLDTILCIVSTMREELKADCAPNLSEPILEAGTVRDRLDNSVVSSGIEATPNGQKMSTTAEAIDQSVVFEKLFSYVFDIKEHATSIIHKSVLADVNKRIEKSNQDSKCPITTEDGVFLGNDLSIEYFDQNVVRDKSPDVFVACGGEEDVEILRRQVAFEAVELLNSLIYATGLCSTWRSEACTGGTSVSGGVEGSGAEVNPRHSSLNLVVADAVCNISGEEMFVTKSAMQSLLEQILTPSLLYLMITDHVTFVSVIGASEASRRPLVIWDTIMKNALSAFLATELARIVTFENTHMSIYEDSGVSRTFYSACHQPYSLILKDGHKTFHPSIADEVTIDGVYIKRLTEFEWKDDIGCRDLPRFVEEIQTSLMSTKTVIDRIHKAQDAKQRRSSITAGNRQMLASQLALKQQVFEHMVKAHPELGFSDLNVFDEPSFL